MIGRIIFGLRLYDNLYYGLHLSDTIYDTLFCGLHLSDTIYDTLATSVWFDDTTYDTLLSSVCFCDTTYDTSFGCTILFWYSFDTLLILLWYFFGFCFISWFVRTIYWYSWNFVSLPECMCLHCVQVSVSLEYAIRHPFRAALNTRPPFRTRSWGHRFPVKKLRYKQLKTQVSKFPMLFKVMNFGAGVGGNSRSAY